MRLSVPINSSARFELLEKRFCLSTITIGQPRSSFPWIAETETQTLFAFQFRHGKYDAKGLELWSTDGTLPGTQNFARNLPPVYGTPGISDDALPFSTTMIGHTLLYAGNNQIWRTDGTSQGTYALTSDPLNAAYLISDSKKAYFLAQKRYLGNGSEVEVWQTDGTSKGTVQLTHMNFDIGIRADNWPQALAIVNNTLHFVIPNPIKYYTGKPRAFDIYRLDSGSDSGVQLLGSVKLAGSAQSDAFGVKQFELDDKLITVAECRGATTVYSTSGPQAIQQIGRISGDVLFQEPVPLGKSMLMDGGNGATLAVVDSSTAGTHTLISEGDSYVTDALAADHLSLALGKLPVMLSVVPPLQASGKEDHFELWMPNKTTGLLEQRAWREFSGAQEVINTGLPAVADETPTLHLLGGYYVKAYTDRLIISRAMADSGDKNAVKLNPGTLAYPSDTGITFWDGTASHSIYSYELPDPNLANVTGVVFDDANRNGVMDVGEKTLAGWNVFIDENWDGKPTLDQQSRTDSSGSYRISNLGEGKYSVRIVSADSDARFDFGMSKTIQTRSGKSSVAHFPVWFDRGTARISGTLFSDENRNGKRDISEPAYTGNRVYIDRNGDRKFTRGEPMTYVGADGRYSFDRLHEGTYPVRLGTTGLPFVPTTPVARTITLGTGAKRTLDFGLFKDPMSGAIRITPFSDDNLNGKRDAGEKTITDFLAYVDANHNGSQDAGEQGSVKRVDSNGDDYCLLKGLPEGDYHVQCWAPGQRITTQTAFDFHLPVGGSARAVVGARFGIITLRPFGDANQNGIWDTGEIAASDFYAVALSRLSDGKKYAIKRWQGPDADRDYINLVEHAYVVTGRGGFTRILHLKAGQHVTVQVPVSPSA